MQTASDNRLTSVTIYKAIAIIMIVFCHAAQPIYDIHTIWHTVARFGQMGCQIFFVLSAFTLSLSDQKKPKKYGLYLLHRIEKVVPAWYAMIAVYILLAGVSIRIYGTNIIGNDTTPPPMSY